MNVKSAEIFVIINPNAGNGKAARIWPFIRKKMELNGWRFEAQFTRQPMEALSLTREKLKKGFDLLVAVGGDGTVNEIVNGFFEEDGFPVNDDAALGIISVGTGQDLIKTLSGKFPYEKQIQKMTDGKIKRVDLGIASFVDHAQKKIERRFINIADMGIGGEVADRVNRTTKFFGGFVSFLYSSVMTILSFAPKKVKLYLDEKELDEQKIVGAAISNGKYFGGGMCVAPDAEIDDGRFDVVVIKELETYDLIRTMPLIYSGKHILHEKVEVHRAQEVRALSDEKVFLDIDGEQTGTLPAKFRICPSALNVLL